MATAVGDVFCRSNIKRAICLMTAQAANTGAPSDTAEATETEGVPAYGDSPASMHAQNEKGAFFLCEAPDISTLVISSSAGSGTMVGTFTLWCYCAHTGTWIPKTVNGGAALAETATDVIRFTQDYTGLGAFDRFFLQLASVGGTATAFEAYLITTRRAWA